MAVHSKQCLLETRYALYRIIFEHAQKYCGMLTRESFIGLCVSISLVCHFVSELFHHFRLANKALQQ